MAASTKIKGLLYLRDSDTPTVVTIKPLPADWQDLDLNEFKEEILFPYLVSKRASFLGDTGSSSDPSTIPVLLLADQPSAATFDEVKLQELKSEFRGKISVTQSLWTLGSIFGEQLKANAVHFAAFQPSVSKTTAVNRARPTPATEEPPIDDPLHIRKNGDFQTPKEEEPETSQDTQDRQAMSPETVIGQSDNSNAEKSQNLQDAPRSATLQVPQSQSQGMDLFDALDNYEGTPEYDETEATEVLKMLGPSITQLAGPVPVNDSPKGSTGYDSASFYSLDSPQLKQTEEVGPAHVNENEEIDQTYQDLINYDWPDEPFDGNASGDSFEYDNTDATATFVDPTALKNDSVKSDAEPISLLHERIAASVRAAPSFSPPRPVFFAQHETPSPMQQDGISTAANMNLQQMVSPFQYINQTPSPSQLFGQAPAALTPVNDTLSPQHNLQPIGSLQEQYQKSPDAKLQPSPQIVQQVAPTSQTKANEPVPAIRRVVDLTETTDEESEAAKHAKSDDISSDDDIVILQPSRNPNGQASTSKIESDIENACDKKSPALPTPKRRRKRQSNNTVWPPPAQKRRKLSSAHSKSKRLRTDKVEMDDSHERYRYEPLPSSHDNTRTTMVGFNKPMASSPSDSDSDLSNENRSSESETEEMKARAREQKRISALTSYKQQNVMRSGVPRQQIANIVPETGPITQPAMNLENLNYKLNGTGCPCCDDVLELDTLHPSNRIARHLDLVLHDIPPESLPRPSTLAVKMQMPELVGLTLRGCKYLYGSGKTRNLQDYYDWLYRVCKSAPNVRKLTLMFFGSSGGRLPPLPNPLEMLYVRHSDTSTADLVSLLANSRNTIKTLVVCLWSKFKTRDLANVLQEFGGSIEELHADLWEPSDDRDFLENAREVYALTPRLKVCTVQHSEKGKRLANEDLLKALVDSPCAKGLQEIHLSAFDTKRLMAAALELRAENFPSLEVFACPTMKLNNEAVSAFKATICSSQYTFHVHDKIDILV